MNKQKFHGENISWNQSTRKFFLKIWFDKIFDTIILDFMYSVWHLVVQIFCEINLQFLLSDIENHNFRTAYLWIGSIKYQAKII